MSDRHNRKRIKPKVVPTVQSTGVTPFKQPEPPPMRRRLQWGHPNPGVWFREPKKFFPRVELLSIPRKIPTIVVSPLALFKMYTLVSSIDLEVGWLGTARWVGEEIIVDDVFLFSQHVSGGHTEITVDGLQEFVSEHLDEPGGEEIVNNIRFWGHSHSNGSTYPSGQDNDQMGLFEQFGAPWFLRGILNRRGEINFSLYDWKNGVAMHNAPWREENTSSLPEAEELRELWHMLRAEMRRKVVAYEYIYPPRHSYGGNLLLSLLPSRVREMVEGE